MFEHPAHFSLDREYSPSSAAPNYRDAVAAYASKSAEVLDTLPGRRLSYGPSPDEYVIVFEPDMPGRRKMLVFIHGGYWQELSADESCFPAGELLERGIAYASINYTLAPDASIAHIAAQCGSALRTIAHEYPDTSFVLAGSSAGAHLAAMLATMDWAPADIRRLSGYLLISGIYDLCPITHTYINAPLKLDLIQARAVSPAFLPVRHVAPSVVCWGEHETSEFKRQSAEHAERLAQHGVPVELFEVSNRNHFDILFDLSDPVTQLGKAVDNLFGEE
ncbi:alpha/beta hydrolase [Burkholderia sp. AU30198]|uniref:alpha/beta hydrolase n=1 Tax=Burkholderia sp. AU30198 TaxID=2879627 RepID=UPI001CF22DBF|nr:alpha/beta hydrolase [Burkholderia sp. AU30198]MCA8299241.1 alpha/beta hydrolase [Burkholderia sp. AU30198]